MATSQASFLTVGRYLLDDYQEVKHPQVLDAKHFSQHPDNFKILHLQDIPTTYNQFYVNKTVVTMLISNLKFWVIYD